MGLYYVAMRVGACLLAILALTGNVCGQTITSSLTGQGADSGVPLSAMVSIEIANDLRSATFVISNTASALSGGGIATGLGVAPYIFKYGWNMRDFDFSDVNIVSPQIVFANDPNNPVDLVNWKFSKNKQVDGAGKFEFVTADTNPNERFGIDLSMQFVLATDPGAPDLTADTFLNAPFTTGGAGTSQNAVHFQVVGTDGQDSGVALGGFGPGSPGGGSGGEPIPEPITLALMGLSVGAVGGRRWLARGKPSAGRTKS